MNSKANEMKNTPQIDFAREEKEIWIGIINDQNEFMHDESYLFALSELYNWIEETQDCQVWSDPDYYNTGDWGELMTVDGQTYFGDCISYREQTKILIKFLEYKKVI